MTIPRSFVHGVCGTALVMLLASPCQAASASERGYLGLGLRSAGNVARVESVEVDGPGAKAGVQVGDSVTAFNGAEFNFESDLALIKGLRWIQAGESVSLTIDRGGERVQLDVLPAPLSAEEEEALEAWIGRSELRERELGKACAKEEFDQLIQSSEVTVTFRKSALGRSITMHSSKELPPNLDLIASDALISGIVESLRPGDQAVVSYETKGGVLNMTIVEIPEYAKSSAWTLLQDASSRRDERSAGASKPSGD